MAKKSDATKAKKKSALPDQVHKELTAAVEKLEGRLAKAEAKAEKWKSQAKDAQKSAAAAERKLATQLQRTDRAKAKAKAQKAARKVAEAAADAAPVLQGAVERVLGTGDATPAKKTAPAAKVPTSATPDETWTVTRLRAEARARGVGGYSRKTKAQLLADLG